MHSRPLWCVFLIVLLFEIGGCATRSSLVNPYFEMPPEHMPKVEVELYQRALRQLKNNHMEESIKLWKRFLEHNPRSFRGYNNLGMALYSSDQLVPSINAFEAALALEPFDLKIKDNLKRALKFQVTIQRENKEYEEAIVNLERVKKLTDEPQKKEKEALKIETLQDLIYEQVKRANTIVDYEAFLAKYPDNPKNSDDARRQIAKMKPREKTPLEEFPERQGEMSMIPGKRPSSSMEETIPEAFVEPMESEPMETVPPAPPVRKESIEIVAQSPPAEEEMSPEKAKMEPEPDQEETSEPVAMKQAEPEKPPVDPDMEMRREKLAPPAPAPGAQPTRRAKIITKRTSLRVREKPDPQSKVLAQVSKGSVVPIFQESKDWYQIEYQKGKKGWISRKYTQIVE